MTTDTLDLPPIETVPMPVATKPAAPEPGTLKATALASFVAIRDHAAKLAAKYRAVAYDVTTPKGMAAAKDARLELREEGRFAVQRLRDRLKDEANDLKRVVTDEAEAVIKIIAPVEEAIDSQIKAREKQLADEKAERERIAAERAQKQAEGVAGIRAYLTRAQTAAGMTAERVGNGIKMLEGMSFAEAEWLDPVAAASAQCETLEGMRALHATLKAREEAAAAAEAQRLENERVAKELAEAQAKMLAEQQRVARITAMIQEIRDAATGHADHGAAALLEARTAVAALNVGAELYQEFALVAQAEKAATLAVLDKLHGDAVAAEAKRAAALQEVIDAAKQMADAIASAPAGDESRITEAVGTQEAQPVGVAPAAQDGAAENPLQSQPATTLPAGDATAESVAGDEAAATAVDSPAPGVTPDPTMTLGEFNTYIAPLRIDGAGLESLGFPAAGRRKAAMLYHDTDKAAMVAAMVKHLAALTATGAAA